MHDLSRQLETLFSGRSRFVDKLAQFDDPLAHAREVARTLSDEEKVEALATHPRIGERSPEQHGDDPVILVELATLNQVYEEKYGFRFIVFVNGRSREELLPVLRERLQNTREEELDIALDELIAIAEARWRQS
ncbi:MAG TPA: 2-oxo-4-hydroxy-4-carboxy-5-ureidoimidazoline decarboxylase [Gaiellaceae bacterium]|nr:2-oxo-4-hydroxy-4-carboxy-5-ureidoimidazoline decarboxylase [Gaiellaceae bacterium]